ncbi:laminin subunit alpha [Cephus cinctus]|uniref:Laminin subunit alpha n=1 Tax=Cephus cinctus TaxID=211228 RepID=A0AAJ7C6H0_CEPCN|nr:laminin subunit alpha [Cephus cinctus]
MAGSKALGFLSVLVLFVVHQVNSEILTPPYFNLAEGREIIASATCGVDHPEPELYCKLVGANADQDEDINLIQGQVCDYCDPSNPEKRHPPEHAVDGMETWWQSPPLSRGMKYNEVNLTINLGQEFHVAYVYVRMGNSPRPGLWILEKSKDYGKTWSPWQYFSDSANDCLTYFGVDSNTPITRDDSVICTTEYSKIVPLEGGEIPISILNNRPSAKHYFNSTLLQEWTRATNVRFRFLRTKNLLGHLMSVARQDPTVTRRYFYSIKDISIGGRCMCNGHADTCDIQDPNTPKKLVCRCQHNTCGPQCATCCKGFEQKKWRQSTAFKKFTCEPCNCFGHSDECVYDPEIDEKHLSLDIHMNYEGGGICQNCRDNTEGINCDRCIPTFYRPRGKPLNATDVCHPCNCNYFNSTGNCADSTGKCECRPEFTPPDCDSCSYGYFGYPNCRPCECFLNGTDGYHCESINGSCPCKSNYGGFYCNLCAEGYYNFPDCKPCQCNPLGSMHGVCDVINGNCVCKNSYGGRKCDICENGYYNYPSCSFCNCDTRGTEAEVCDKTDGHCLCKEGYGGARCDQCSSGYYGYPNCRPCNCSIVGSSSVSCDASGKCSCLGNFAGRTCDQCSPGFYMYPDCIACNCDNQGSNGVSCDTEGRCQCWDNFDGEKCAQCKEGYYNFPTCEGCNCDPAGVVETFMGCGSLPVGELCQCKDRVQGRICNQCRPLYWNLQQANPQGCEECKCNIPGVIGSIAECDTKSGQCICKPGVTDRACTRCIDGTYNLEESNLFGCSDCACDIGGSVNSICDKISGQCPCQPRVTGLTCNEPLKAHYFPTLHQFQYEVEDGRTSSNSPVRYGFAENLFPGYSWKGYAVFSALQDKVIQLVDIHKSSLYRMVLRYVNPNNETILGSITIIPENPSESEQKFMVQLKPSSKPAFVTVAGAQGNLPSPLVMNPGRWSIVISTKKSLFLDYFVLLPSEYYEATILTQDVNIPCEIGYTGLCRHYGYPSLAQFDSVNGVDAFSSRNNIKIPLSEYFQEEETLREIGNLQFPLINENQEEIQFDFKVANSGLYVLIVTYITSKNEYDIATINVEASNIEKGKVTLYPCKYTSICRQVVTDRYGKVAVLNLPSDYIRLILTREPSAGTAKVSLNSVVAIPYNRWSLDYISPKSVCVRKNGKCVQGIFPAAADSKKIEFETSNEVLDVGSRPYGIYDNSTKLIHLNNVDASVDVPGKAPQPGEYVFVVQYFQPDHPQFELDVLIQNGKSYEAKVPVPHCPSNSGCRSIIRQSDGNTKFQLNENFVISFKETTGNDIWLDYILVIPTDQYGDKLLKKIQFDQTKEFIKKCGNNHFHINVIDESFCRDSIFSLTTNYNNGALPCQCDIEGTRSFECEKFGGQCPCKPNIIGRRCEICKTGFYGFPNCRPCNCPSTAICEQETGACICPPRVTGERCDECESGTYGFHPIIGCEECNCAPQGVQGGDLQCDLFSGSCRCRDNVVGRQCDKCLAGFSQFPLCEKCDCDTRGTTYDICDQRTAECYCKANVLGQACDICKEGTFNIQESNEEGCTKCFCFGKTTRCASADLYRAYVFDMVDWDVVYVNDKTGNVSMLKTLPQELNETSINVSLTNDDTIDNVVYFSAPRSYLGKKLTSYGGYVNYTVHYSTGQFGNAVAGPDLILYGADIFLLHYGDEQPPSFTNFRAAVEIVESKFVTLNRSPATREQIMVVLENLHGIYIRATYWQPSLIGTLSYVTLDITTEDYIPNSVPAHSVEQCQCPPNYQGLSCEECAPGYYRVESGPYGGYCVPCQCNNHADTCDVNTGICYNCKNGTTGDHCELCEPGYYGNATVGTPSDCLICACPLPYASNNFANGCEVNEEGSKISCDCLPGYYGARCEVCAAGYYGKPDERGNYCRPCECSGNIDTNEIGACDSITGECLHCLNNTYGEACNLCAPGYFGDAVDRKDCQSCICDTCGMEECDSYNGGCLCKENVIGDKCDRCEINHYGFESCDGCKPCECSLASESSQCDDETGQCKCKPGVTGRKCDQCIPGYWNYGPHGCISCGCNTGYSIGASCNTTTGHCTCLPGVIGEKCDECPHRYVFILDAVSVSSGCYECDICVHDLLDVTDSLENMLEPVTLQFNKVAESYFTNQRLKFINDTVNELHPEVELLDPRRVNFLPLQQEISRLDQEVANQKRKVDYAAEDSIKWKKGADKTLSDMNNLEKDVMREIALVNSIIMEVQLLASNIEQGTGAKVDSALKEAKDILKQIQEVTFTEFRDRATDESGAANVLISEMQKYNFPVSNLSSIVMDLNNKVKNFSAKIDDLNNITNKAQDVAGNAERLNLENKLATETGNFDSVKNSTAEILEDLEAGEQLNKNASLFLNEALSNIYALKGNIGADSTLKLNETIFSNDQMLVDVLKPVQNAKDHADSLYQRSLELDNILTDTRNTTAVRAVSAYKDIEEIIQQARQAAEDAHQAANNATELSDGIEDTTSATRDNCLQLLESAKIAVNKTEGTLQTDLHEAQKQTNDIIQKNQWNNDALDRIEKSLINIPVKSSSGLVNTFIEGAEGSKIIIQQAISNMNRIVNKIPNDLRETKQLSKDSADSNRDISQANKQLDSVSKIVPNITNLLGDLSERQKLINSTGNDLQDKIEYLKNKIANARELADRFKTGLTFYRNTTLELKNPENFPLLATSTKISLYFRTNKTNGFLLYLGNEEKANLPRMKSHDFMALLIENGYPVLIVDLGSGPEKMISNKFVSDNVWRQVIVDRTGKNIKLIVREDIGEGKYKEFVKEQVLPGSYSIFNLDQEQSKLFVGGYPSSFQIQNSVTSSSFDGEMEELVIGDIPVSFWNFIDGENNRQGAIERNMLINLKPSTGFRFDGNGYAVLSKENSRISSDNLKFSIILRFKTLAEDGLIFQMINNQTFLSLEMQNGHVLYRYSFGEGEAILRSTNRFNDGDWHTLNALRLKRKGVLKIDGQSVAKAEAPGNRSAMILPSHIYFGGYPPSQQHAHRESGFEGCIDDVVILDTSVDLRKNIEAFGVVPGCPVRFSNLVSFEEHKPGYVKWPNTSISNSMQINLKFKTASNNGLIFYVTNSDQTATSSLSLVDGLLSFKSQGEELRTSDAGTKFNDNEWHVITATHEDNALRLDIDDTLNYSTDSAPPPIHILYGNLYIGGLPSTFSVSKDGTASVAPFAGCIGDATLNGIIINFANTTERPHSILGKCKGSDQPTIPSVVVPIPNWRPPPPPTPAEGLDTITMAPTQHTMATFVIDYNKGEVMLEGRKNIGPTESISTTSTTTTPKPITVDECRLPFYPANDTDLENAWRIGTAKHSRLEYRTFNGRYKNQYDFQIDIKTMADDGIIFYSSDFTKQDLIALYIEDGRVNYKFDCGSGPALMTSVNRINDNKWHTVVFKRNENCGELIVDEFTPISGCSQGHTKTINLSPPFFVGGIIPDRSKHAHDTLGLNKTFNGCIGNFMMNGQVVGEPTEKVGVIPCSKRVEPGLFFYPGNGSNFFKAIDKFTVGRAVDIQMDIKPRSTSGHLLSVHGKRDFLILEMINGTIKFLVKTAKGVIETTFQPTMPNSLCDGNWHNIHAAKQKNTVVLSVDHKTAPLGISGKNLAGVFSKHPIYVGGHPLLSRKLRGSVSHAQYVGCIKNIMINRMNINLDAERINGHVTASVCPTI